MELIADEVEIFINELMYNRQSFIYTYLKLKDKLVVNIVINLLLIDKSA